MALPVHQARSMDISPTSQTAHRVASTFHRGLAAVALVALALTGVPPAAAAPADHSEGPALQHTT
jgi:hypothetical protein